MGSATSLRLISIAATLSLILIHSTPANSDSHSPSIYEVLQHKYNFPVGLLPKDVNGYSLDPNTGEFSAYWNTSCSFFFKGIFRMKYAPTISGFITNGKVSRLRGVSVSLLVVSLDIVEIVRSIDYVIFSLGFASAGFPADNFQESPKCWCGFNCDEGLTHEDA